MSTRITVNGKCIKSFTFSGGEAHVSINHIPIGNLTEVEALLYNADDIMELLLTIDAIREAKVFSVIHLTIPYFPYGRQDRVCNTGESFSLNVMAKLINSLQCQKVTIMDPHSDVTILALNDYSVITQNDILRSTSIIRAIHSLKLTLVSPDAGAELKTREVARENSLPAIYCSKVRDVTTGQITNTKIPPITPGEDFIILDDICDGGRTFIELAKKLKEAGANQLYLYVTHGIFSKGLAPLQEHFTHIYCYHTFLKDSELNMNFLTVIRNPNEK